MSSGTYSSVILIILQLPFFRATNHYISFCFCLIYYLVCLMVPLFLSLFVSFLSLCNFYSKIYLPIGGSSVHLTTITGQWEYVTTPEAVLPSSIRLIPEIPLVPNTIKLALFFSAYSTIAFVTEPISKRTSVCTFNFLADASCFTSSTIFCPFSFARSKYFAGFYVRCNNIERNKICSIFFCEINSILRSLGRSFRSINGYQDFTDERVICIL